MSLTGLRNRSFTKHTSGGHHRLMHFPIFLANFNYCRQEHIRYTNPSDPTMHSPEINDVDIRIS